MQEDLRDYQKEMLERLHQAWEEYQSVMVQMPTGTGKTYLMAEAIRTITNQQETISRGGVLILAHRIELIEQISRTLDRFRIEHGLIVSGKPIDEAKLVQVASIQTLTRRIGTQEFFSPSLIIIDEAHHAVAETYQHLYRSYKEFADGKRGIVYAINREHARHIAEYYSERGLRCAVIDSKTPAKERRRIVEEYRNNEFNELKGQEDRGIDILVNVDIFSEGFDVPEVEFIQLARPTLSLSKYLQQVGRGMRVAKGKQEVIILDQVGLYLMFSLPTSDRNWQGTFLGRISGKGRGLDNKRETINNNGEPINNKWLVNEQMFRIKSIVGGKNQEKNLQSSVSYENSEAPFALWGSDYNSPTMEFCKEMAENLQETLRTNRKVLVQIPPYVEKVRFVISLMRNGLVENKERQCMELPKTLVVVRNDYQADLVEREFKKNGMQDAVRLDFYDNGMKNRSLVICHEPLLSYRLIDMVLSYEPSLIVVWDANYAEPSAYMNALHVWPKVKVVGLSLAPCDIRSITKFRLFDMVLPSQSLKSSIDQGLLKDVEYVSVPPSGLSGMFLDMLRPKANPEDYVSGELYGRLISLESMACLFKAYKEHADNKRGIVYAFNETHAEAIAEYYSCHGVPAKVFYGDVQSKPKFPMEKFCSGNLKVLVDVHGVSTNYPLPEVQFVQLAYPTQLLSEYLNMVETRMRVTTDFTEGERVGDSDDKLLVIDHVKMKDVFGLPTDERDWQCLFDERRIETEREPAKPKNKPRRSIIANGHATVATKWQQRKERLLNAPPVYSVHQDETLKV